MEIPWYIFFTKMLFMNFSVIFTILKIINYKGKNIINNIYLVLLNIIFAAVYAVLRCHLGILISYIIYFCLFLYELSIIIKLNFKYTIILGLLSIAISLISFLLASTFNFMLMTLIKANISNHMIEEYLVIGLIQILFVYVFFKIKRFKDGFSFIKEKATLKNENIVLIIISSLIIFICMIYIIYRTILFATCLLLLLIVGSILMMNRIKTSITKYYKERMKDRTVELQTEQLKEKDEIISNLNKELSNVLEINHKYNKRLSAMEKAIGNFGDKLSFNEEFAKEYSDILDSLNDLSKEYKQEFENYNILPKTNIFSIDNLLDYMKTEAIRNNIEFDLEINGNINELIEKHISKSKLETLLGDHITDAITAINASDNSYKKIKVIIGKDKEFYKISVLDTGIEFEIETLLKLGLERITTHKDSGGTGIGFMTTFETLKECKASLVIEEYNKEKDYTKSVNVIFDGKSEYNINSYRAEKINYKTRIIE